MSIIPERFWAAHIGLAEIALRAMERGTPRATVQGPLQASMFHLVMWAANNHQVRPQLDFRPTSPARALQANAYLLAEQTGIEVDDAAFDRAHEMCLEVVNKIWRKG